MASDWHSKELTAIIGEFATDSRTGLSTDKAAEARRRFGQNKLEEARGTSVAMMLVSQLKEFLVILLIAAALISALVGEVVDAVVILSIVVLSAVSGVVQELKAEKSIQALRQMSVSRARVIRDGRERQVDSTELVPGDIVLLEAGDRVPADSRLIEAVDVRVDESLLTGESAAVEKRALDSLDSDTALGDRVNMLFSSTTVLTGRATAVVVATGMKTEVGKIASMMTGVEQEETPLQRRLGDLGKRLGAIGVFLCAVIFVVGVIRGIDTFEMFMTSISLAVAAVPEGLPAIVTVVLALGVQRMSRENAIIRRLSAVETLGSATVICSDKTGTLTQNKMVARRLVVYGRAAEVSGEGYEVEGRISVDGKDVDWERNPDMQLLIEASVLCNNSALEKQDDEKGPYRVLGDPTEGALLVLGARTGLHRDELLVSRPRVGEIPFDSDRKRMTTVHAFRDSVVAYVKGAFDSVIELATAQMVGGKPVALDEESREFWVSANNDLASQGMRVLAVAMKALDAPTATGGDMSSPDEVESSLTLIGLVAMIDPPREEARAAVAQCRRAGIIPVMITGDHKSTAAAIARETGILDESGEAVSGAELDSMDEDTFAADVKRFRVYARVSPHHKMRIVNALQQNGEVVAMTGDGVNDAPALKKADIGVAMGVTGTDVAKEASDMVLADDNFATIVKAVEQGRVIFDNIRKAIYYLVSCNAGELIAILSAIVIGLSRPLEAIQILWVNLVTDGLPALALGVEKGEADTMSRPPRDPKEGVFTRDGVWAIAAYGFVMGLLTLLGYYIGWRSMSPRSVETGRTVAFGVLVFGQLFHAFNIRCGVKSVFSCSAVENRYLVYSIAGSAALQLLVMLYPPLMRVFKVRPLTGEHWAIMIGLALMIVPAAEGVKAVLRMWGSKRPSESDRDMKAS